MRAIFGGDALAFSGNFGRSDDCPLVLRGGNLALNFWKDIGDTANTESIFILVCDEIET